MKRKYKIAIVSDAVLPYNVGGKEKRIFEVSTGLADRGHNVTVYCMKWWKNNSSTVSHNKVTYKAISPLYPLYSGSRRSIKQGIMFSLHCFKMIKEDFDILEADHMPHLVLFPLKIVSLLKKKKLIVTWNEVWGRKYWINYMGIAGNIAYLIERISVFMPNEIISISQETSKRLVKLLNARQKIFTIPMGIDLTKIQSIEPSNVEFDVMYAGRLLKHKNINVLISAIKLLKDEFPDIRCVVIGEGPEKAKLTHQVKELLLNNNVTFKGFISNHDEVYSIMKSSKVFAFPSSREGFGIVVLEANACNLPVVTVNAKDNLSQSLINNNQNGLVVDLDDLSLANGIKKYLSNSVKRISLNDFVKSYDWKYLIQKHEELFYK